MTDSNDEESLDYVPDIDDYGVPDNGSTDNSDRYEASIVPDHGPRPRRRKRPLSVVYKRDPHNTYRPADDPFLMSLRDDGTGIDDRRFSREREIARLLTKTARDHAPRLSWRADSAIAEVMEREVIPNARFVATSLPPDAVARVLAKFVGVLWEEISLARKKRRNTKS